MASHPFTPNTPVSAILDRLTGEGGRLNVLVRGAEPFGVPGVFFEMDDWKTVLPFVVLQATALVSLNRLVRGCYGRVVNRLKKMQGDFKVIPGFPGLPAVFFACAISLVLLMTVCVPAVGVSAYVSYLILVSSPEDLEEAVRIWGHSMRLVPTYVSQVTLVTLFSLGLVVGIRVGSAVLWIARKCSDNQGEQGGGKA